MIVKIITWLFENLIVRILVISIVVLILLPLADSRVYIAGQERLESPIEVFTDKNLYYLNDVVKVNGTVPDLTNGRQVNVIVKDVNMETYVKLQVVPNDDTFSTSFLLPNHDALFPEGEWNIRVSYAIWVSDIAIQVIGLETALGSVTVTQQRVVSSTDENMAVNDDITIISELKNNRETPIDAVVFIHVIDKSDNTLFFEWTEKKIEAHESTFLSMKWTPAKAGDYRILTYVWTGLANPIALSHPVTTALQVTE